MDEDGFFDYGPNDADEEMAALRRRARLERWKRDQRRADALPVAGDLFPDLQPAPAPPPPAGTMGDLFR